MFKILPQDPLVNLSALLAQPEVLEAEAGKLQRSIAWETMVSRGVKGFMKYGIFFGALWVGGIKYPEVTGLFRSGYLYWRYVDDVADNDRPLPQGYNNKTEYLHNKRTTLTRLFDNSTKIFYGERPDILLVYYHSLAARYGIDLTQESFDILDTIIFDEERARQRKVATQAELDVYFAMLDSSYIKGTLKITREDGYTKELSPLSKAVSKFYTLRDFPKDFKQGLINISREDIDKYNVDLSKLDGRSTVAELITYEPIKNWYRDYAEVGLKLLDESDARLGELKLKPLTGFVLRQRYERAAKKGLTRYAQMAA